MPKLGGHAVHVITIATGPCTKEKSSVVGRIRAPTLLLIPLRSMRLCARDMLGFTDYLLSLSDVTNDASAS